MNPAPEFRRKALLIVLERLACGPEFSVSAEEVDAADEIDASLSSAAKIKYFIKNFALLVNNL